MRRTQAAVSNYRFPVQSCLGNPWPPLVLAAFGRFTRGSEGGSPASPQCTCTSGATKDGRDSRRIPAAVSGSHARSRLSSEREASGAARNYEDGEAHPAFSNRSAKRKLDENGAGRAVRTTQCCHEWFGLLPRGIPWCRRNIRRPCGVALNRPDPLSAAGPLVTATQRRRGEQPRQSQNGKSSSVPSDHRAPPPSFCLSPVWRLRK